MLARSGPGAVLAATLSTAACAHSTAPKDWLAGPVQFQSTAYGGWIELTYLQSGRQHRADGELIAVSADSVWVLSEPQRVVIPTNVVERGKLTAYAAESGKLSTWTLAGTLATISNGVFLTFTAPMWLIGGSLAAGGETRSAERKSPPLRWSDLAPYARFPQGLPHDLEFGALHPKTD